MTDDELQQRLRRLAARPEADWDAMAAAVRDGYDHELRNRDSVIRRRRWWATGGGGALAVAAALALWLHGHHPRVPTPPLEDELGLHDADPDELIDELSPAQLDRVAQALKKGA